MATVHCALGDTDRAVEGLQSAVRGRDWNVALLKVDPRVDTLRANPRFTNLLRQVNL